MILDAVLARSPESAQLIPFSHLFILTGAAYEVVRYVAKVGDLGGNLFLQLWMLTC